MVAPSSTVPLISPLMSLSKISLISINSHGFPMSIHSLVVLCPLTTFPSAIWRDRESVISYSPLGETSVLSILSKMSLLNM